VAKNVATGFSRGAKRESRTKNWPIVTTSPGET